MRRRVGWGGMMLYPHMRHAEGDALGEQGARQILLLADILFSGRNRTVTKLGADLIPLEAMTAHEVGAGAAEIVRADALAEDGGSAAVDDLEDGARAETGVGGDDRTTLEQRLKEGHVAGDVMDGICGGIPRADPLVDEGKGFGIDADGVVIVALATDANLIAVLAGGDAVEGEAGEFGGAEAGADAQIEHGEIAQAGEGVELAGEGFEQGVDLHEGEARAVLLQRGAVGGAIGGRVLDSSGEAELALGFHDEEHVLPGLQVGDGLFFEGAEPEADGGHVAGDGAAGEVGAFAAGDVVGGGGFGGHEHVVEAEGVVFAAVVQDARAEVGAEIGEGGKVGAHGVALEAAAGQRLDVVDDLLQRGERIKEAQPRGGLVRRLWSYYNLGRGLDRGNHFNSFRVICFLGSDCSGQSAFDWYSKAF